MVSNISDSVGLTLLIDIMIVGVELKAVVDTAAQISMLSLSVVHKLEINLTSQSHNTIQIKNAENDSFMSCFVLHDLQISIAGRLFHHTFAVGPITDDVILGIDFWAPQDAIIDLPKRRIKMRDLMIPVLWVKALNGHRQPECEISVSENCSLAPLSQNFVAIQLSGQPSGDFVTTPFFHSRVLGPASVIQSGATNWISVVNDTNQVVELQKNTFLTMATEVETVLESGPVPQVSTLKYSQKKENGYPDDKMTGLPSYLQDLFDRSVEHLSDQQQLELASVLTDYQDTFAKSEEDLGVFDEIAHKIATVDEVPVQERLRRTPLKFAGEEEAALQKMLDGGIIKPSTSAWASAPVLVRKKDGSVRYAIDYRKLNAKTVKDAYPLPLIAECIDALQGSEWFHALDLASGYWQILLDPNDAHKTLFITKYGLFEYTRMPFGLCNAPATFQRVMHLVLRGMVWKQILVYLDDVVILGTSFGNAMDNLKMTLHRFRQYNLKLKPKKCHLFQQEIKFLGRKVSKDGIRISDEHTECIRNWPTPKSLDDLLKFLGFINYHRDFIPRLSEKASPLFQLTRKGVKFEWTGECEASFNLLKNEVMSAPFLSLPVDSRPFLLDTDASNFAIAGCLYQIRDGVEYPISFASQSLTGAQQKYCTTRKELLAIVVFTRQFRHYLLGSTFTVRTDHGSLVWLYRFKEPTGQLGRWMEELSQYDMIIQHRPGRLHGNADALSRIPVGEEYCRCYEAGKRLESLPCGGCNYCQRLHHQWARFDDEVDNVIPLAVRSLEVSDSSESSGCGLMLSGYTPGELRDAQLKDPALQPLILWLERQEEPDEGELMIQGMETKQLWNSREQLRLTDGVLRYDWVEGSGTVSQKLVVPHELRVEIVKMAHDGTIGGHWGRAKTAKRVKSCCFWPSIERYVAEFIATCAICSRNKHHLKNRAELMSYQSGVPNERVHLDFLGPFTPSHRGNKYILSMVDQFTKWIEICALPEQTAVTTAKAFFDGWIVRFGVPLQIHTDQGSNFTSGMFTDLCRLLQSTKTRTTPYRPSSNGQVERYNQMILSYIRCQLSGDDRQWDEHLPAFGLSLRSTVNRNTGYTPNMLQLGREVHLPMDIVFGLQGSGVKRSPSIYIQELEERM